MTTKEKPATGWHREAGYSTAFNNSNDSPFALRLKALLISISGHDAALIALAVIFAAVPLLAAWRAIA